MITRCIKCDSVFESKSDCACPVCGYDECPHCEGGEYDSGAEYNGYAIMLKCFCNDGHLPKDPNALIIFDSRRGSERCKWKKVCGNERYGGDYYKSGCGFIYQPVTVHVEPAPISHLAHVYKINSLIRIGAFLFCPYCGKRIELIP